MPSACLFFSTRRNTVEWKEHWVGNVDLTSQNLTLKGLGKLCCQEMGINKAQIVTGLQGRGKPYQNRIREGSGGSLGWLLKGVILLTRRSGDKQFEQKA